MAYGGPHLPEGVRDGAVLLGKYRIGAILGAGAMGTVVAARHLHLEKDVAIKFLRPEVVDHRESRARFYSEARAADRIAGDHVVRVFDVGTLESGEPYIVMERLLGCDLATWLQRQGRVPIEQAVDFILQACDAVGQAHDQGIVHRDLKPANLFVVERPGEGPILKVLDFGIAKNTGMVSATLPPATSLAEPIITEERALMGTPFYMSPEQLSSSREVDARTDVWALGVVLFQLVTGKLPFEGTLLDICARVAAPLRPRQDFEGLPAGLEAILSRCLERDRERRYRSARELAAALRSFSSGPSTTEGAATLHSVPSQVRPFRRIGAARAIGAALLAFSAAAAVRLLESPRDLLHRGGSPSVAGAATSPGTPRASDGAKSDILGTDGVLAEARGTSASDVESDSASAEAGQMVHGLPARLPIDGPPMPVAMHSGDGGAPRRRPAPAPDDVDPAVGRRRHLSPEDYVEKPAPANSPAGESSSSGTRGPVPPTVTWPPEDRK